MHSLLSEVTVDSKTPQNALGSWRCTARSPGSVVNASELSRESEAWLPATVPGTVAKALDAAGLWDFSKPTDLDASDWWFQTRFAIDRVDDQQCRLRFDGLATLAEVWLNDQKLLATSNMFRRYSVDIAPYFEAENELTICFRSLSEELKQKRPRPRWKTNLVKNQQLRWMRTSLIGRIPGWSGCAPTIGPWRDLHLEISPVLLEDLALVPILSGDTGVVRARAKVLSRTTPQRVVLHVGAHEVSLEIQRTAEEGWAVAGELQIPNAPRWWPHTHGSPELLECFLVVEAADVTYHFPCCPIGFRKLEVRMGDGFAVYVNDEPIFCRGACWTVSELLAPSTDEVALRHDLQLVRDSGANMLRIGGTMNYETETFYQLCDELGLLVWQDFMFANMDYPVDDAAFREEITSEAKEQLIRLARHPSVAIYCGNSEIEQQSAMLGMPSERWTNDWFSKQLPELCATYHPGTLYVPSTPTGGALPFHTNTGITHYYGIGAYLRSSVELRQADVKFTSECLGFANVPEPATIYAITGGNQLAIHDPLWKQRTPRDTGAGWDFEDVRDHYLREIYNVDPVQLRSFDMPRYLELSRAVSGEMMAIAFSEWRSTHTKNRGGLVWFYKDLWPGAGWGIVDSTGLPKAAYYYLKRIWHSRQLTITNEGLNGLDLHLTNETAAPCCGSLEIVLLKEPDTVIARQEINVRVEPRSQQKIGVDELLGRFFDVTYAYRFGAPQHDIVVATWFDESRAVVGEAFHFVRRIIGCRTTTHAISASAEQINDGRFQLTLSSDRFLHTVRLEAEGFLPDDNYFHLLPHRQKTVTFRSHSELSISFRVVVQALNLDSEISIAAGPAG